MELSKKALSGIQNIINGYETNTIQIVDGLYFNQYETLRKIEFYWNSRYINSQKDEIGRIKPFYNISKFRSNVATRATDLDVKDVKATSDNPSDRVRSLIFNKELYNWMKESDFSEVLNKAGSTRPKYGGVLIKKCIEKEDGKDKLEVEVVEWKNVITDPVCIEDGVIIEKHYMSPSELSKKMGVWENVEEAMKLATKVRGKDATKTEGTEMKIPVYEVHGEFPETFNPEVESGDDNRYEQMLFIIAGEGSKAVPLWFEIEDEMPYKYLAWDNVSGRGLGIGVVEDGFEAQMWTNDAIIAEKNVMDLAGKVFIKTTSEKFGNNILTDAENGQVFNIEDNATAELFNLMPNSLPQFQNLVEKWNTQYERATNTFDAVTGETLPSNTPLGSVAIQSQQASSFFDYRREEAGIFWREVFNDWVIPFLIKKINKAHILASDYSPEELDMIDSAFAENHAEEIVNEKILNGEVVYAEDRVKMIEALKEVQKVNKERRYLDIPDNYFKDFEAKITIDLTGESKNKQENLTSLFNVLTQMASNPALLQDPNLMQVFNQMLELSGIKFYPKAVPQATQEQGKASNVPVPTQPALTKQTNNALPEAQQ